MAKAKEKIGVSAVDSPYVDKAVAEILAIRKKEAGLAHQRQRIEDWLVKALGDDLPEGKTTFRTESGTELDITRDIRFKVDAEVVDSIAKEQGLEKLVPILFRFKAEVNATSWKNADEETLRAFAPAVTATPSKPAVSSDFLKAELKKFKDSLEGNSGEEN